MAASQPPNWQPPSRRQRRTAQIAPSGPDSRAERNRMRREQSMEKQFRWLFATVVAAVTLYLMSRTPWGLLLIHHFLQHPTLQR